MTTDPTIPSRNVERPGGAAASHLAGVGPAADAGAGAPAAVDATATATATATAAVTADPAPDAGTGAGAHDGTGAAATPVAGTGAAQPRVPVWPVPLRRAWSWLGAVALGRSGFGGGRPAQ